MGGNMTTREQIKKKLGQPRLRSALEKIQGELDSLSESELLTLNLDPLAAIATVRGALPKLQPLRGQILSSLPNFEAKNLDRLELYALALMQAHAIFLAAKGRLMDRTELAREAYKLRKQLLSDVTVLKQRGLLPFANLSELKGPNGHLNIACDVMSLANMIRGNWDAISSHYPITIEELDRAEVVSDDLTQAVGTRERVPEALIQANSQRIRAYTLFIKAYAEVRHALVYIRRPKRDYDRIAPSLYHGRKPKKKTVEPSETNPTEVTPFVVASNNDPFLH
jgi:hypothetical protein